MIAFRYTKTEGAQFISHLDTLRHLNKIFVRGGIEIKQSQGFHPHPLVYMASPIPLGLESFAEYCAAEADMPAEVFMEKFNVASPRGIKCTWAANVIKNPNFAAAIDRAEYAIEGLRPFDVDLVLGKSEFFIEGKGGEKDVRQKIYSLGFDGATLKAVIAAGNNSLRADRFCEKLAELYGGEPWAQKTESYIGATAADDFIRSGLYLTK